MMSVSVAGIQKNRCRTTVAEPMGQTGCGTALCRGDQVGTFRARSARPRRICNCRVPNCPSRHSASANTMGSRAKICRSEEHTSELQSRENLVCRLLLEKKKKKNKKQKTPNKKKKSNKKKQQ